MDVMTVFIIGGRDVSIEQVKKMVEEDSVNENIIFGMEFDEQDRTWEKLIDKSDEVWLYGTTTRWGHVSKWQHSYALQTKGKEKLWRMG